MLAVFFASAWRSAGNARLTRGVIGCCGELEITSWGFFFFFCCGLTISAPLGLVWAIHLERGGVECVYNKKTTQTKKTLNIPSGSLGLYDRKM